MNDLERRLNEHLLWMQSGDGKQGTRLQAAPDDDWSSVDLRARNLSRADLRSANFSGVDLSKAVFTHAEMQGAKFVGARLDGAKLTEVQGQGAVFSRAHLRGALLHDSDLQGADFTGADLTGAYLTSARVQGGKFHNAGSHRTILDEAQLNETTAEGASFAGARIAGANLTKAILINAIMTGTDLSHSHLTHADLSGANLSRADFYRARLESTKVEGTTLRGARRLFGPDKAIRMESVAEADRAIFRCVPWDFADWEFLRFIGTLRLFAPSYAAFIGIVAYVTALRWYNAMVLGWHGWAYCQPEAALRPWADLVLKIPSVSVSVHFGRTLIAIFLLAVAATVFLARSPSIVKEWSESRWRFELNHPVLEYRAAKYCRPLWRYVCFVTLILGGGYTGWYILVNAVSVLRFLLW